MTVVHCPMCGPWRARSKDCWDICPKCKMTPGEHHYRDLILADREAVLAMEWAVWRRKRAEQAEADQS